MADAVWKTHISLSPFAFPVWRSLGYYDTLMSASAITTSSELTGAELAQAGGRGWVLLQHGTQCAWCVCQGVLVGVDRQRTVQGGAAMWDQLAACSECCRLHRAAAAKPAINCDPDAAPLANHSQPTHPRAHAPAGISSGLVRLSVGFTGSVEQRWAQLEEAFLAVTAPGPGGGGKVRGRPAGSAMLRGGGGWGGRDSEWLALRLARPLHAVHELALRGGVQVEGGG